MQAIVPAAGEGTRLRPLTDDRPKGLVEIAGKPILSHCFESLLAAGIGEIVVVVGYRGDDIVDYYGDDFRGVPLTYVWQEEQLGLGHAVLTAAEYASGDVVVWNGDNVGNVDLSGLIDHHRDAGAAATLLIDEVSRERAREGAVFVLDDEEPVGVVEKPAAPPSTLVPLGVFVFAPRVFEALRRVEPSARGEYELADAVDRLFGEGGGVEVVHLDGWLTNVNTVADVERVSRRVEDDDA
ncbi:UTP--glucose-1-phosphate uridylyltransferase [Haloplanus rubicundus]|uniref:UTP--glucose-1-phosphate uridylyltransferase n=1 Tax=Haloplanus rubicundus TaxID=1547898 RepID=A0A345E2C8_9EURY|nr:sugar phosphate nucleotidyltransferase [Haloplanus rubicundus]AXG06350.1 UTP--glucose-1-phosphate uridylyltransferase [Haloplanus rubicundus]